MPYVEGDQWTHVARVWGGGSTWLTCSGLIHLILEGHFSYFNRDLVTRMDFLSQLCACCDRRTRGLSCVVAA